MKQRASSSLKQELELCAFCRARAEALSRGSCSRARGSVPAFPGTGLSASRSEIFIWLRAAGGSHGPFVTVYMFDAGSHPLLEVSAGCSAGSRAVVHPSCSSQTCSLNTAVPPQHGLIFYRSHYLVLWGRGRRQALSSNSSRDRSCRNELGLGNPGAEMRPRVSFGLAGGAGRRGRALLGEGSAAKAPASGWENSS